MWKKDKRPPTPVTLSVDNCSRCKRVCSANENSMTSDQDKSSSMSGREYINNFITRGLLTIIPYHSIPQRLSEWKRKHIENLKISILYTQNIKPLSLLECGKIMNYADAEKMPKLKNICRNVEIIPFHTEKISSFDSIPVPLRRPNFFFLRMFLR